MLVLWQLEWCNVPIYPVYVCGDQIIIMIGKRRLKRPLEELHHLKPSIVVLCWMCMHDALSWPAAGIEKYDCEGRLITAEYDNFYFLTSCEQLYMYLTT